jgi:hypothetical protein
VVFSYNSTQRHNSAYDLLCRQPTVLEPTRVDYTNLITRQQEAGYRPRARATRPLVHSEHNALCIFKNPSEQWACRNANKDLVEHYFTSYEEQSIKWPEIPRKLQLPSSRNRPSCLHSNSYPYKLVQIKTPNMLRSVTTLVMQ